MDKETSELISKKIDNFFQLNSVMSIEDYDNILLEVERETNICGYCGEDIRSCICRYNEDSELIGDLVK